MRNKYELIPTGRIKPHIDLYQIRYLESGLLGGYVDSPEVLSQEDECLILGDSYIGNGARVTGNAIVINSRVSGQNEMSGGFIYNSEIRTAKTQYKITGGIYESVELTDRAALGVAEGVGGAFEKINRYTDDKKSLIRSILTNPINLALTILLKINNLFYYDSLYDSVYFIHNEKKEKTDNFIEVLL